MDPFRPKFTIAQIEKATGVPATTIRMWYSRGVFTLGRTDQEAQANGMARTFSGATAVGIGITKAVSDIGVSPTFSANAAIKFAHAGCEERPPCSLFQQGKTILIASGENSKIFNLKNDATAVEFWTPAASTDKAAQYNSFVAIELNELVVSVGKNLGLDEGWITGKRAKVNFGFVRRSHEDDDKGAG